LVFPSASGCLAELLYRAMSRPPFCHLFRLWYLKRRLLPRSHFILFPTFRCDYYGRCPYCHLLDMGFPRLYPEDLPVEKAVDSFLRFSDSELDVSGGEPFLWRGIREFVEEVGKENRVGVTTNLSWEVEREREWLSGFSSITASYHPEAVGLEEFLKKVVLLRSIHPKVKVNVVAYPPLLHRVGEAVERFRREGIFVHVDPYLSPLSPYTKGEREWVRLLLVSKRKVEFPPAGLKKCDAGRRHFVVLPDGSVYTCWNGCMLEHLLGPSVLGRSYRLGNLLEGTFSPLREELECWLPCSAGCDLDYVKQRPITG